VVTREGALRAAARALLEGVNLCGALFWFGSGRQQKHHAAAPPPARVRRRMKRKRQKLVGRDKGSLTEQQTKGTVTTTIQIRRKYDTNSHNRPALSDRTGAARSPATSESPPRRPPPPPEPSVTAQGMEYQALFGQVGSAPPHPGLCPFLDFGEN